MTTTNRGAILATRGDREDRGTAVIYTRISQDKTGERAGVSRQLQECRDYCKRRGWEVVGEFDDNDISATKGRVRPQFEALLASQPERVVVWDVDRFIRLPAELERAISAELDIYPVTGSELGLNLTTTAGRLTARIVVAVAAQEGEHKAERVRLQAEQRAAAGEPKWSRRPFGYEWDKSIREPEAALIREGYAAMLGGSTSAAVARSWNAAGATTTGGKPWTGVMVSELLRSPRNAGILVFRGAEVGRGTWEPIVDEETFRAVERIYRRPGRKTSGDSRRKYLLTGVAVCARCGGSVVGSTRPGKPARYRCVEDHFSVPVDVVDARVKEALAALLFLPSVRAYWGGRAASDSAERARLLEERRVVEERMAALAEDYADGVLDRAQLLRATERLREQRAEIDAALSSHEGTGAEWWADDGLALSQLEERGPEAVRSLLSNVSERVEIRGIGRGRRPGWLPDDLVVVWARPTGPEGEVSGAALPWLRYALPPVDLGLGRGRG